jgi:hypothetical protein
MRWPFLQKADPSLRRAPAKLRREKKKRAAPFGMTVFALSPSH